MARQFFEVKTFSQKDVNDRGRNLFKLSIGSMSGVVPAVALLSAIVVANIGWTLNASALPQGKILYTDGKKNIVSISPDGSDRTVLGTGYGGQLSPDGTKIVFFVQNPPGGYEDVFTMNADGSNIVDLTPNTPDSDEYTPTWSPDGSKIAYVSDGVNSGVYTMNSDGSNPHFIIDGASNPTWSPDGTRIAYVKPDSVAEQIGVANADGTNEQFLTTGNNSDPSWSPDGSRIAWIANCNCGNTDTVSTMWPDGTHRVDLVSAPTGGGFQHTAWSPDSSQIIFTMYNPNGSAPFNYHLDSVPAAGGSATEILADPTGVGSISWGQVAGSQLVNAINAGGSSAGSYSADGSYNGGTTYSSTANVDTGDIPNPAPQSVYQTVRYGNNFSYTLSGLTANATYTLRLHFNEPYWGTALAGNSGGVGSRVFNVAVNGTNALSNFDIYKTAGGANRAVMEQIPATADSNGNIAIDFSAMTDNATVSGVELYNGTLPPYTPPAPTANLVVNAGGDTVGSFSADTEYSGGTAFSSTANVDTSTVTSPAPEAVYQSARYGKAFSYNVAGLTPNGSYKVRLHFNELYWGSALAGNSGGVGSRVFNVAINGSPVLNNFDVYQAAGGANKAVVEEFTVPADSNGNVTIGFTTVTDNAMVNGIELVQQ